MVAKCEKKCHRTREVAIEFAKKLKQDHIAEPYYCKSCKAWHLTTGVAGKIDKARKAYSPRLAREWLERKARGRKVRKRRNRS